MKNILELLEIFAMAVILTTGLSVVLVVHAASVTSYELHSSAQQEIEI